MTLKNKILTKLSSLEVVASPAPVLAEILTLLDQESSNAKNLTEIILKDPNLTARILKAANSSFYGVRQKVNTINQAVLVLGLDAVKCLVLSISIYNQLSTRGNVNEHEFSGLWRHFLESAAAAKNIAINIKYPSIEEAYIAGLLHDFGRLFLLRYFSPEVFQTNRMVAEGARLVEAEEKIFGLDHQEIGHYIATKWNLPDKLVAAIGAHHPKNEQEVSNLSLLTKIAALAEHLCPNSQELPETPEGVSHKALILDTCCTQMGIGMDVIQKIYGVLPQEVLHHAESMEINIGDAIEYLTRTNMELFNLYVELASTFKQRQELSKRILADERVEGTLESLHIALATLSHYINNSTMSISGQCEVVNLLHTKGDKNGVYERIPGLTDSIRKSIKKISIVLQELSNITTLERINYFKHSKAIDIEKSLKDRLERESAPVA